MSPCDRYQLFLASHTVVLGTCLVLLVLSTCLMLVVDTVCWLCSVLALGSLGLAALSQDRLVDKQTLCFVLSLFGCQILLVSHRRVGYLSCVACVGCGNCVGTGLRRQLQNRSASRPAPATLTRHGTRCTH